MRQRDPALLERLREYVDRARDSGEYVEGPWIGNDALILRSGVTRFEVRYLIRQPARSWEFPFGPKLTVEELFY